MHRRPLRPFPRAAAVAFAAVLVLLSSGEGHTQSCSDCPISDLPQPPEPPIPSWGPGPVDITTANTDELAAEISGVRDTCGAGLGGGYQVDCLRQAYAAIAAKIPDTGDYRPIRQALLDASARLDAIVTENLDPAAPTIRPREKGRPLAGRLAPVRAIAPDRRNRAARAAEQVIAETGLLILRSGEIPKRRTAHYQEIAAALDDSMVVLRSL